ncbi:MAG: translation initiation factor IF-6, partial [Candidatus Micrarchaeota archaeon]
PYVGLFLKTNDYITLLPKNTPEKLARQIEHALQTKPVRLFVNQSHLLGLFTALNDNGCVMQDSAERQDIQLLKKTGLNVSLLKTHSPGINILCNNKAALLNPDIPAFEAKKIGDCLGVEVFRQKTGVKTVGTGNVVTDNGLLAYNETSGVELKYLEKIFQVKGIEGTTNFGSAFNGLGAVANKKGALVGELTTGVETQRVFEALGG